MTDAAMTCFRLYLVVVGLIMLALFLGFPVDVAASVTTFASVVYLLFFAKFVKTSLTGRLLPIFVAAMLAAGFLTDDSRWTISLLVLFLFIIIAKLLKNRSFDALFEPKKRA